VPKGNSKQTSAEVASKASALLRDGRTGAKTKSVAGSALAQTKPSPKKKQLIHHTEQGSRVRATK
jgi:hypothetical protein